MTGRDGHDLVNIFAEASPAGIQVLRWLAGKATPLEVAGCTSSPDELVAAVTINNMFKAGVRHVGTLDNL